MYLLITKQFVFNENPEKIKFSAIVLFGIGGMFICYFLFFLFPEFSKNYFFFTSPFLYILIGVLISKLGSEIKYAIAGATIFFGLCSFAKMNLNVKKPMDYKNAIMVVKKLQKPGTAILAETKDVGFLFAYYFDKNSFKDFTEMESKLKEKNVYLVTTQEDIRAIDLNKYNRVVLTQTFQDLNPDNKKLIDHLSSLYKFNAITKRYGDPTIILFARK